MQYHAKYLWLILLTACFCLGTPRTARAEDVCAICGKPIPGNIYLMTDKIR